MRNRLGALGDPPQTAALSSSQVAELLSRNGTLHNLVTEFNILDFFGTYTQSVSDVDFLTWLLGVDSPIPPAGVAVQDSVFGPVIVFPDASGVLRFTQVIGGQVPASVLWIGAGGQSLVPALPTIPQLTGGIGLLLFGLGAVYLYLNRRSG